MILVLFLCRPRKLTSNEPTDDVSAIEGKPGVVRTCLSSSSDGEIGPILSFLYGFYSDGPCEQSERRNGRIHALQMLLRDYVAAEPSRQWGLAGDFDASRGEDIPLAELLSEKRAKKELRGGK